MAALGAWIARETRGATDRKRGFRFDGRAVEYGDVFVLTRTAREGREIGKALRAARIPHAFYKEDGLFQSAEAKDLRALMAAIESPEDPSRRIAAWLTPFFGLPLAQVEGARTLPPAHPLVSRLYAWKALAEARDFDRLFESVVTGSGIVRREIFFADGERDLTNYLHLLEILTERARGGRVTLRDLAQELSGLIERTRLPLDLEGGMQRMESDRSAVQIMTVHKAKGLEAPVVFVAAMNSRRADDVRVYHEGGRRIAWVGTPTPDVKDIVDEEEDEEDQRLMYVALTRAMGRLYLPCVVDDGGEAKALRGAYESINRRLAAMVRAGDVLLAVEDEDPAAGETAAVPAPEPWAPPPELLRASDETTRYAVLRERHAPAIVTSYTRLRGARTEAGERASAEHAEERRAEKSATGVDEVAPGTLRAARTSGVFLHEVLERIPLPSFGEAGGLPAWRHRPHVAQLFDEAMAAHRIDPAQREHAEQLVWAAYTTPIALPNGERLSGLVSAGRIVREMDFLYSMADADAPTAAGEPGYVRGSLDLAFEHGGLTYFADWKSDALVSYAPDALARHVTSHYMDQARLYALAVVRLLGVRSRAEHDARFGGVIYCFLRGLSDASGTWAARPSWEQVLAWEDELRGRPAVGPGGAR
jgi:exodeoxyribonuclease V beta subunit